MSHATISFKHPLTGAIKNAPVGYSWTTLLFGFFVPLLRGHWVGAVFILALSMFIFLFAGVVMSFIYNKMYIKHLIGEGYKVSDASEDIAMLAVKLKLTLPTEKD